MSNPRIKDLKYTERLPGREPASLKRAQNKRAWQRQKAKNEMEKKKQELKKWGKWRTFEEQWSDAVEWSEETLEIFMRRTGRIVNLRQKHYHISRRGEVILDIVKEEYGGMRTWLTLTPGGGHRPLLNQEHLRNICKKLGIPYYREMSTDEMRAVLTLLANMDGIDPRRDSFEV